MPRPFFSKVPEYPRPHDFKTLFGIPVEAAAVTAATIIPIVTYDEGLGAMQSYESNPANASFVESQSDHCYPTSKINKIFCSLEVNMSKVMLETDKVHAIKFATATIHTAFNEGALALDDLSTLDLNEILELQSETTDRQTMPLWNDVKLKDYKANLYLDQPAEKAPFLATDLEIEAVVFNSDDYYDCLHYYTNGDKLKSIMTPLKWHTLTRNNPTKTIYFTQQSNTKYMNPYAMLAALIYVPGNLLTDQIGDPLDTTIETSQLQFIFKYRYNEFNHEFNHAML